MRNPTRRNRNIGTSKQGHGQNNELRIPYPALVQKEFYERLESYQKISKSINGKDFDFVIEETRKGSVHACSIDDLVRIIELIPEQDHEGLKLIILRQPKRKEETISPVWGRLIYSFEFEGESEPAIILEAVDKTRKFKWSKKLTPDERKELDLLKIDGHNIQEDQRSFQFDYEIENVRNTQLFRTLPHEFGHYVHYLEVVERLGSEDEDFEQWESRHDSYFKIPNTQKEKFANSYVKKLSLKRF
ncbi:hypothetical protein [Ekhidna sp.]|uniref:hypothetical protein n=1 Tax=Ekhidna sp. TaxID=2608089 RepID=UPI0032969994